MFDCCRCWGRVRHDDDRDKEDGYKSVRTTTRTANNPQVEGQGLPTTTTTPSVIYHADPSRQHDPLVGVLFPSRESRAADSVPDVSEKMP